MEPEEEDNICGRLNGSLKCVEKRGIVKKALVRGGGGGGGGGRGGGGALAGRQAVWGSAVRSMTLSREKPGGTGRRR